MEAAAVVGVPVVDSRTDRANRPRRRVSRRLVAVAVPAAVDAVVRAKAEVKPLQVLIRPQDCKRSLARYATHSAMILLRLD